MLYNLLSPNAGEWIATILAFIVVFGGFGTALVFLVIFIIKSIGAHPSEKEFDEFIGCTCPFTKESWDRETIKDNGYYEEEKEEEKVRMKSAGYGEYYVDKVKVKTGGKWVPATYRLVRYTEKTLGYTIVNEYSVQDGYQAETSWTAESYYTETKDSWTLENPGSLTKKQQAKIMALCKKRSSCSRSNRW